MVIFIKRYFYRIAVFIKTRFILGVIVMFTWEYVFQFLLFFGDPLTWENGTWLQKQEWQRELNLLKLINLKSFPKSYAHFLWNQALQIWHETFFLLFPEHFPFTKPTFCTAVLDKQRKLSNKCRPVPEEYQINSSHQTVVHFESKFISIRKAKLCYITTLPFARRALF